MNALLQPHVAVPRLSPPLSVGNFLLAAWICGATLAFFLTTSAQLLHWFVLPVTLCGVLIFPDGIDWFRGRIDRFDPRGMIGLLGFHFFFLAPLMHVSFNHYMREVAQPDDWREWLGIMAVINAIGLLAYRAALALCARRSAESAPLWGLNERVFYALVAVALPATAALQVWVYQQYGGILGYIQAGTDLSFRNSMPGMGLVFMFSESFPIVAMMGFAVYARKHAWCRSWAVLGASLAVFFVLAMLFGGLRGNRSNTVWNLFWAVAILHFYVRRVPLKVISAGIGLLVLFMYAYGFYKWAGAGTVDVLQSSEAREALSAKSGRTFDSVLLSDFGRSDVQAFLLYRITAPTSDYRYALGRTYFGGVAILIPKPLWPDRPVAAAREGTEAMFGVGTFVPAFHESSRVYGLAGEALLNFGPASVPIAFFVWGLGVGWVRGLLYNWNPSDARFLLYPLLVVLVFMALFQDMENMVFFLFKYGLVPFCVAWPAMVLRPAAWGSA